MSNPNQPSVEIAGEAERKWMEESQGLFEVPRPADDLSACCHLIPCQGAASHSPDAIVPWAFVECAPPSRYVALTGTTGVSTAPRATRSGPLSTSAC